MASVAAIAVGMVAPDEVRITLPQGAAVGIGAKAQHAERLAIGLAQFAAVPARGLRIILEARADGVERIDEIRPSRRRCPGGREGAGLSLPATIRGLGRLDLLGAHAAEKIIAVVERPNMVEAEPAPVAGPVERGAAAIGGRRSKLAHGLTAGLRATLLAAFHPAMKSRLSARARQSSAFPDQTDYISEMSAAFTGPVADEITRRLTEALGPTQLRVTNDSARHRGHAGDDGSGESHFTVEIEAPLFAGKSRLERQRAVNSALGELLADRIHALAIKARAPGE